MILYDILVSIIFLIIVELIINKFNNNISQKFFVHKYFVRKNLKRKGCFIKTHKFVQKNKNFRYKLNYLYNKQNNLIMFEDSIFIQTNKINFNFILQVEDDKQTVNFSEFYYKKSHLCCEYKMQNVLFIITIDNEFRINYKIINLIKSKINVKCYCNVQNIMNNKVFTQIKGNFIIKNCGKQKTIGIDTQLNRQISCSFKLKFFTLNCVNKLRFYTQRKYYTQIIYKVLSRDFLTNYKLFEDVKKFLNNYNLRLQNIYCVNLFNYEEYKNYKKILENIEILNKFDIKIVCFYKRIICFKNSNITYINYYSNKLHIYNYLQTYYSINVFDNLLQKSYVDNLPQCLFDYKNYTKIYLLKDNSYQIDTSKYFNYYYKNNSIVLQNQVDNTILNFSKKTRFTDKSILNIKEDIALIVANKHIKVDYLQTLFAITQLNQEKILFINFWQENFNYKLLQKDVENSIMQYRSFALIYYLNENFYNVFTNLYDAQKLISQFISFYYLVKADMLGVDTKGLISKYKNEIFLNLINCYNKSQKSNNPESLILLYLHSKNLLNHLQFSQFYEKLVGIRNSLFNKLNHIYTRLSHCKTFDEIINNFEPTLFNYELIFEYLIQFQNGNNNRKDASLFYNNPY